MQATKVFINIENKTQLFVAAFFKKLGEIIKISYDLQQDSTWFA